MMVNNNLVENIINELKKQIEEKVAEYEKELAEEMDFGKIEEKIEKLVKSYVTRILEWIINQIMGKRETIERLKPIGGTKALKYKEYREIGVRLYNGETIKVKWPYFIKTVAKMGVKKRGSNGRGNHLGLEVMGFIRRSSLKLVSEVVEAAVLCPSFEIAEKVLNRRGITIDLRR